SLENSVNEKGEKLKGQYKLTIKHIGESGLYGEYCTLVISTKDAQDNKIEITSEKFMLISEIPYNITITTSEGGTAEASKTQVAPNGQVSLTATPQEGYRFVNWTVNGEEVSTANPYTATILQNTQFTANFERGGNTENGHEYVDLGLSVKWATCNVGATTPEEYGDYFAWGETQPKSYYYWSTYKYYNGSYDTMTKYCTESNYDTVDNKTTLELSDDAAYVNWGGNWRMPTIEEQKELLNTSNCTWRWTTQNGVKGRKVTSKKNGNSIFLPAAGYLQGGYLNDAGDYGDYGGYWSSSLTTVLSGYAYGLYFYSSNLDWYSNYRCYGLSVRAVCE
ncbi:MAG: hypothetical protein IKV14_04620, partial [Muribaculaceae bacterium]|nr:hypothetical protein [Muribaculaceae bacterium]